MSAPRTDSLEKFLTESNSTSDLGKFHRMGVLSRDLERELIAEREKAKELRNALETTLYNRHQQADILNILAKHKV